MSMLPLLVKPLIKAEIDKRIHHCIALLAGELNHRPLTLKLNVDISDILLSFTTVSPFGRAEEEVKTDHHNGYSWTETTGNGKPGSILNNPGRASLEDFCCSGTVHLGGIQFEKQIMGMTVKLNALSFRFRFTGSLMY